MRIIKPDFNVTFHTPEGFDTIEQFIEYVGRTCYKSEDKIVSNSAAPFVRMLKNRGHHAMLEHGVASARIIADRGLTHELVRHRIASFAQESTRFCNYSKGKFDGQITVIEQPGLNEAQQNHWASCMRSAENNYMKLLELGVKPEIARSVLPIGVKSEINITANLREWMLIFELRCSEKAHPIIRGVMLQIRDLFINRVPSIFGEK